MNTELLDALERKATDDEFSIATTMALGDVLQIERCLQGNNYFYRYQWGKHDISRTQAIALLEGESERKGTH